MKCTGARWVAVAVGAFFLAAAARGQNGVQWGGNSRAAIEQAKERMVPLVFWVTDRSRDRDDDHLEDAQEESFRDPAVVALIREHFIPVRVARNSNVQAYAQEFGLPTTHGMYIAVLSPAGKVLAQINPGDVAEAQNLAARLAAALGAFKADAFETRVRPVLSNLQSARPEAKTALDLVWRFEMTQADELVVGLFARPDMTPTARRKIYSLLAMLATERSVDFLLEKSASDREAKAALAKAEGGALEFLLRELPQGDAAGASAKEAGPGLTEKQRMAYDAVCGIARAGVPRPEQFWEKGPAKAQAEELARVRQRAEAVLAYWEESVGQYR